MSNMPVFNPESLALMKTMKSPSKYRAQGGSWSQYFLLILYKLSLTRYEWDNLPDEGPSSVWIEQQMTENSYIGCWQDKDTDRLIFSPGTIIGKNMYGEPINFKPIYQGTDNLGFPDILSVADHQVVIIRDNILDVPFWYQIIFWSEKLAEVKNKIDINFKNTLVPFIAAGTPNAIKNFETIYNEAQEGKPIIGVDKDFAKLAKQNIYTLSQNSQYLVDKFQDYFQQLFSEALKQMGVNVVDIEKKERLITSEAESSNDVISRYVDEGLIMRKKAVEEIKKYFGVEISVRANSENNENDYQNEEKEGGTNDESNGMGDTKQ